MTPLLDKAIVEVSKLTPVEQDAIAVLILDELADEQRWDAAFARTEDQLDRLVEKVRQDIRRGRVKTIGMDEL